MDRFFLQRNDTEECWELMERNAIRGDDGRNQGKDALLARFYDGSIKVSPIGEFILSWLKGSGAAFLDMVGY